MDSIDLQRSVLDEEKNIIKLVVRDGVEQMHGVFGWTHYGYTKGTVSEKDATGSYTTQLIPKKTLSSNKEFIVSVKMPPSIRRIPWSCFSQCVALTFLEIPNGVEAIEDYAFSDCTSLKVVVVPASVGSIARTAFYECNALEFIFIEAKSKDDFDRVRLLLPENLQSKAIFGKKLWDDIVQITFSELYKAYFSDDFKRSVAFGAVFGEIDSFLDDISVINIINAVPFPVWEGDPNGFLSLYKKSLNDLQNRYFFASKIKSFFSSLKTDSERLFLESISKKVENYSANLDFSLPEKIFILQHDCLFSAFRLFMKNDMRMEKEKCVLANHSRPKCLSVVIRALSETHAGRKWLQTEGHLEKCIEHPELKQLAHLFSDTQWGKEKTDLMNDILKIDNLFNQTRPFYSILSDFFGALPPSEAEGKLCLFSIPDKRNEAAFLEILSLLEVCVSLSIPYKKETILSIKQSIIQDAISGLQNLSALVKNLRVLQERVKDKSVAVNGPLSVLLAHLKKSDVNKIPRALWETSFSFSPEECAACNDCFEKTDRQSKNRLK